MIACGVYQLSELRRRTKRLALGTIFFYRRLPRTTEAQTIGHQWLGSATPAAPNNGSAYWPRAKAASLSKPRTAVGGRFILSSAALIVLFLAFGVFRASIYALTVMEERKFPPPGRLVDVGGHRLHLYCTGTGSPVVILEAGLGRGWDDWYDVVPEIAKITKVCVYDRAGYGWSDPGPQPRSSQRIADELHVLLTHSAIRPPYVLVGHSFGAFIVRIYANKHPQEIAGLVLVDPMHEDFQEPAAPKTLSQFLRSSLLPKTGLQRLRRLRAGTSAVPSRMRSADPPFKNRLVIWSPPKQIAAENSELSSMEQSVTEVRATGSLAKAPLVEITSAESLSSYSELQAYFASRSKASGHVLAQHSSHMVQLDEPEVVVRATLELIANAKGRFLATASLSRMSLKSK